MANSSGGVVFSVNCIELCNWFGTATKKTEKKAYCITNQGNTSKRVRAAIGQSSSNVFRLRSGFDECSISAGLSIPVVLLFNPEKPEVYHGTIEIFDGEKLVQTVPVTALPPHSKFEISPAILDFGNHVNENQGVSKSLIIKNTGNKRGSFEVNSNSSHFELSFSSGNLDCNQSCNLTVRLLCNFIDNICDDIRFIFDDGSDHVIKAKCNVVQRILDVMEITDYHSIVNKVVFKDIFYGDCDIQQILLFNNSPVYSNFMITFNSEKSHCISIGGSLAITMKTSQFQQSSHQIENLEHIFQVVPKQGTLAPYQKSMIKLAFTPQTTRTQLGWKSCQATVPPREYSVMVDILLVDICNQVRNCDSGTKSIALSATARPVAIKVIPRSVNFGTCITGTSVSKTIEVVNLCDTLPIKFRCKELAQYRISPSTGVISVEGKAFIQVLFQPKQLGSTTYQLIIDLWADERARSKPLSSVIVSIKGNCISACKNEENQLAKRTADVNDLAQSIRPSSQTSEIIRTPFTRIPRYSYHDSDYHLEEEEVKHMNYNKDSHIAFLRHQYSERKFQKKERSDLKNSKDHDLGMYPGVGLVSPIPRLNSSSHQNLSYGSMQQSGDNTIDYIDCSLALIMDKKVTTRYRPLIAPNQLENIVVDPETLHFGKICPNITIEKTLSFTNKSKRSVVIKIEISKDQLQFTCFPERHSIAILLKPLCYTIIALTHLPKHIGSFESCLTYTINDQQTYNIPITAQIEKLSIEVSPKTVKMCEENFYSITSGLWGSVQLKNHYDIPITFKWDFRKDKVEYSHLYPINQNGVIPANATMICGFACNPEFNLSSSMKYDLYVENGVKDSHQLCTEVTFIPVFKSPLCVTRQKRVLFSNIPVNLISSQTLHLENQSDCHAYFKVLLDKNSLNLKVYPSCGYIPANGALEMNVSVHPLIPGSFDINLAICIKESKTINVRVTGSAEIPKISIKKEVFDFGGVLCGSSKSLLYIITNQSCCRAQLTFDFSCLPDFTVNPIQQPDNALKVVAQDKASSVLILELPGKSSAKCELQFRPCQVASYNFYLTVLVNGLLPRAPPGSPWPPCNPHSSLSILDEGFSGVLSCTPIRQVLCSALLSPLQITNSNIQFVIPPALSLPKTPLIHHEKIELKNISNDTTLWALDTLQSENLINNTFKLVNASTRQAITTTSNMPKSILPGEKYEIRVLFQPEKFGRYSENIPLLLNGMTAPYCSLSLDGSLLSSTITTVPRHLVLDPVPIGVTIMEQFLIVLNGFTGNVELDVQLPDFGDESHCVVNFPNKSQILHCKDRITKHMCVLEFKSLKPISKTGFITISETSSGIRTKVPLTVAADNSMFSVYEFLAQNLNPVVTLNEGKVPIFHFNSQRSTPSFTLEATISNISSEFKEMYLKDCVSSLCRWISCNGFSSSKCVNSPIDFCCKVVKDISNTKVKERSYVKKPRSMLVDMLSHLCGRLPPGIPLNLPPCTTNLEKIIQQYSTYNTVLTFLRNQGAILSGILPESLLEYENYLEWSQQKFKPSDYIGCTDEISFKKLSEKAWTKVLMQVIKVLVIPRLLSKQPKEEELLSPYLESSQCNLYSMYELKLLSWLNHHFKAHRQILFGSEDSKMQARHLVHFDVDLMDSMALSCVLYSYCPFLKSTYFDNLYVEPSTPEQCAHNALIFVDALKTISFSYDIQPSDILSPNPIFMVLFCAYLYSTLTSYVPVQEIKLCTKLGKRTNAKITVSNPSLKSIDYLILIRGDEKNTFSCSANISVPPQESQDLTVIYTCHSLSANKAILLLVSVNKHPSVASYSLHGSCTVATPKIHKKSITHLYEPTSIDLPIAKMFKSPNGKCTVNLVEIENGSLQNKPESSIASSILLSGNGEKVKMFYCSQELDTKLNFIRLQFVGLKLGFHQCYIIVTNSEQYDIVLSATAEVKEPLPMLPSIAFKSQHTTVNLETKTIHLNTVIGETIEEHFIVQSRNEAFEDALIQMSKWEMSERDLNQHLRTGTLKFATLSCKFSKLFGEDLVHNISEDIVTFTTENNSSENFHLPSILNVPTHGSAEFPIKFSSSIEGQYECHLLMKSGLDIRVLIIEATVFPKDNQAQIEFKTTATLPITQKIPVINPSTSDWLLKASIVNSQFNGPEKLAVPALSTASYSLTFNSQKEGNFSGKLILVNAKDFSKHIFQLIGNADRPCAQDFISLQAQVDKRRTHLIHIPNHKDRTVTFHVTSDLDFISGPKELVVGGDDMVDYCITILPKRSGLFTGALVFKTTDMDYRNDPYEKIKDSTYHIWYQVNCKVEPSSPVKTIFTTCPVMSSKQVDVSILRSIDRTEDLEVIIECDFLSGPLKCSSQDTTYNMIFNPLSIGIFRGRIVFSSSTESEFWYEICLEAVDPEVVAMPTLACELGRSCQKEVILCNPIDKEVHFSCSNSNIRHYSVSGLAQGIICIDAHSQKNITVSFSPSTLGNNGHHVDLAFTSQELGMQVFAITGTGVIPSKLELLKMKSTLDSSASHTISFSNPLRSTANLQISLRGKDFDNFNIFARQSASLTVLQEGESIDIAVVFSPKKMHLHEALLSISTDMPCACDSCEINCKEVHKICWEYSIIGQPQVILVPFEKAPRLVAKAKSVKERILITQMSNSSSIHNAKILKLQDTNTSEVGPNSKYSYEIKCKDEKKLSTIHKHLKIQLIGVSIDEGSTLENLTFKAIFSPPKAINGICELHVCSAEGGLWIVPLQICTNLATPDDIVTIESTGLNKVSKTSFHLTSTCLDTLPFTTHFLSGSDPEITVVPTSGILLPSNTNGTQFIVSYKPTMYGKQYSAKFVVQCDMAEWCYEIIGKIPNVKYSHPYQVTIGPEKLGNSIAHTKIINQTN